MNSLDSIKQKVLSCERLTEQESLLLFRGGNLYDLGFLADNIRKKIHPEPVVT